MRRLALGFVFIFSGCGLLDGYLRLDNEFSRQRGMIKRVFAAYENGKDGEIRRMLVPKHAKEEFKIFDEGIKVLYGPAKILSQRFFFTEEPKLYKDPPGGSEEPMADVELCFVATLYDANGEYRRIFYLFYHFHFTPDGRYFIYLNVPYAREDPLCAPQ